MRIMGEGDIKEIYGSMARPEGRGRQERGRNEERIKIRKNKE
jgi:hypothetical protein